MKTEKFNLWKETPGMHEEIPTITAYIPDEKKSNAAIVIFAGGAYLLRSEHEGEGYGKFLAENGYTSFVCDYRVAPHRFPLPLLDARRAVRTVRYFAERYGIDKNKIAVMGSSAGGHLAAMEATYYGKIDFENIDEIDNEDFLPNAQILCYPVISLSDPKITNIASRDNLLGDNVDNMAKDLSANLMATEMAPKAFIWHTFTDDCVSVKNSLYYAQRLKDVGVSVEMHIFPEGEHGKGLCLEDDEVSKHMSQWSGLMLNWLKISL